MINEALQDKLPLADLQQSKDEIKRCVDIRNVLFHMMAWCDITTCSKQTSKFRCFPYGKNNADIMILGTCPSEWDFTHMTTYFGISGHILTDALSKFKMTRDDVYMTYLIKCYSEENKLDLDCMSQCVNTYFRNELHLVRPKLILTDGTFAVHTMIQMGLISELNGPIEYGNIYHVKTYEGNNVIICPFYNLKMLSEKPSADFTKFYNTLLTQFYNAFVELQKKG